MKNRVAALVVGGMFVAFMPTQINAADAPNLLDDGIRGTAIRIKLLNKKEPVYVGARVPVEVSIINHSTQTINLPQRGWIEEFVTTQSDQVGRPTVKIKHTSKAIDSAQIPAIFMGQYSIMTLHLWHIFPSSGTHTLRCFLEMPPLGTFKAEGWMHIGPSRETPSYPREFRLWEGRLDSEAITVHVKTK